MHASRYILPSIDPLSDLKDLFDALNYHPPRQRTRLARSEDKERRYKSVTRRGAR